MSGIYIASTVELGPRWVEYKEAGWPIVSSWIYEADAGQVENWADLWRRCVDESKCADGLILIAEGTHRPTGSMIEVGAALASNVPVAIVGDPKFMGSARNHPGVIGVYESVESAFQALGAVQGDGRSTDS